MGERKERQAQIQQAIKQLVAAVDAHPDEVERYYELGIALTEQQSYPQAEELLKRALSHFNGDNHAESLLRYGLGNVYYASGLYQEALGEFQQVRDEYLKGQAYMMIAQTYYAQKKYQQALVFALTASEQLKRDSAPLTLMGNIFMALGNFEKAYSYYTKALTVNGQDLQARFQRGVVLTVQGKDPAADFAFVKRQNSAFYERMQARLADTQKFMQQTVRHQQEKNDE
ncbi:tetratricopeptide repeat protein [Ligilactobacillus sp. LYQ60]|uniref:tetratricopeptide repeat protein n=1 Tax=unclassified Ligilactobacillus TaxID=2767920 RepID=UPI003851DF96